MTSIKLTYKPMAPESVNHTKRFPMRRPALIIGMDEPLPAPHIFVITLARANLADGT
jgi:hypothetical protein